MAELDREMGAAFVEAALVLGQELVGSARKVLSRCRGHQNRQLEISRSGAKVRFMVSSRQAPASKEWICSIHVAKGVRGKTLPRTSSKAAFAQPFLTNPLARRSRTGKPKGRIPGRRPKPIAAIGT